MNQTQLSRINHSVRVVTDRTEWNKTVLSLPNHHVLQSWEWGEFKSSQGWSAERLLFYHDDAPCAAAQVLTRRTVIPVSLAYVPKGPVLDYSNKPLWDAVLSALVAHAKDRGAFMLKIDPDIVVATGMPSTDSEHRSELGESVQADLASNGWLFSSDQIQFRNTVQVDLSPTEDDLLAAMKSKTRYNIRLSVRKGVSVRIGTLDDLPALVSMYHETAERDQFLLREPAYYHTSWSRFIESGLAHPLIAYVENEPVAAVIPYRFGDKVWYMIGASRNAHREKMPNHLLQWEAMRWAKDQGAQAYDFWGAPDEFVESDPMWGVWRFKSGFGGKVVQHIGAWDKVIKPGWHRFYRIIVPLYLQTRRALSRR